MQCLQVMPGWRTAAHRPVWVKTHQSKGCCGKLRTLVQGRAVGSFGRSDAHDAVVGGDILEAGVEAGACGALVRTCQAAPSKHQPMASVLPSSVIFPDCETNFLQAAPVIRLSICTMTC